jgi:hypothetical protein
MPADTALHENLSEAFCAKHGCRPSRFAATIFWKSLPPHALVPAYLLGGPNNPVFDHDMEVIIGLATARSIEEIHHGFDDLGGIQALERSRLRRWLGVRVSPERLRNLLTPLVSRIQTPASLPPLPVPVPLPPIEPSPIPAPRSSGGIRDVQSVGASRNAGAGNHRLQPALRIHAAIVAGRPVDEALAREGLRMEALTGILTEFAGTTPEAAWLLGHLQDREELRQFRERYGTQRRITAS